MSKYFYPGLKRSKRSTMQFI